MSELDVDLLLTTEQDAQAIRNLYPLYLHDIASYEHLPPNRCGVLDGDDQVQTWDEALDRMSVWWNKPGVLFPYLIRLGDSPAGFMLIASGPYLPTPGIDFVVHEFFLAQTWRGTGIASDAARRGLAQHTGTWEVPTWTTAPRAIAFWRKTLPSCTNGDVTETEEDHPWGRRVVFRFDSRRA